MTRKQLAARVEHWRRLLLPEWRVLLFDEPPDWAEDAGSYFAICQTAEHYPEARLHFTDECLTRTDAEVETTIVHELLHPIMREMRSTLDDLRIHVASGTWTVLTSKLEGAEERAVDRISRAIVALGGAEVGPRTAPGPVGRAPDALDLVDHQ